MAQRIIGLTYVSGYNALQNSAAWYAKLLAEKGYETEILNLSAPDGVATLEAKLRAGDVAFCFAPQGVGSRLGHNERTIWEHYRVPFIGIHIDNPCYNIFNHFSNTRYVANFYFYESFADIYNRYISAGQVVESGILQLGNIGASNIPYRERSIRMLYLKTGESVEECARMLNTLPPALRDGIWQQLKRAEVNPNFQICDLVQEVFDSLHAPRAENFDMFWGCAHWMDMYLRRKHAADFVEWLKMQDGAVIIGDGWDFIDKSSARAIFRPSVRLDNIWHTYRNAKIVCNTNPYGRDVIHERLVFGLLNQSLVISDTNAWLTTYFDGDYFQKCENRAVRLFSWAHPLDDQLQDFMNMDEEIAEARADYGMWHGRYYFTKADIAQRLIECAKKIDPSRFR
jgi:hypothetical protein